MNKIIYTVLCLLLTFCVPAGAQGLTSSTLPANDQGLNANAQNVKTNAQNVTPNTQGVKVETVNYQQRDTISLKVFFQQGSATLNLDYMNNRQFIGEFVKKMSHLEPTATIDTLKISGSASPEGNLEQNKALARNRANAIKNYITSHTNIPASRIILVPQGENWDGLEEQLKTCTMPWAKEALRIVQGGPVIKTSYDGIKVDDRKYQLQQLDEGRAWPWMLENYFPELRRTAGGITCVIDRMVSIQRESRRDTLVIYHKDTLVIINQNFTNFGGRGKMKKPAPVRGPWWEETKDGRQYVRKPVMALRTNLFVPGLNVGVEIPIGNRWSFEWDHYYPWAWRQADHKNCFQLIGEYAGIRLWLGDTHKKGIQNYKYRLTGHSLAAIGAVGYYDFEKNFDGFRGEYWAAGLDYTYALPVAKGKLRIEFDIAAGYFKTVYKPYDVYTEGGYLIHRNGLVNTTTWFGPIKAGINFVVPINHRIWLKDGDINAVNNGYDIDTSKSKPAKANANANGSANANAKSSAKSNGKSSKKEGKQ